MNRKLVYINKNPKEEEKLRKIKTCAVLNKIKLLAPPLEEVERLEENAELLKMIDFGNTVNGFLLELKKIGITVDYKCIETETNRNWPLHKLYEEVKREHEEMKKRG